MAVIKIYALKLIENLRMKYFKKNNKILNIFKRRQFNLFVNYVEINLQLL